MQVKVIFILKTFVCSVKKVLHWKMPFDIQKDFLMIKSQQIVDTFLATSREIR